MTDQFEPNDGCIRYARSYAAEAEALCSQGANEVELAKHFQVSLAQIQLWCACHPEFRAAVAVGAEVADQRVTMALYRRATGYDVEEPFTYVKKDGTPVTGTRTRHVPAEPSAAQYWLENRQPELWRNRAEVNHNIKRGDVKELSDDELTAIIRRGEGGSAREVGAPVRPGITDKFH